MTELTPVQWRVLTFIQRHEMRWQVPPKLPDIRYGCALSTMVDASSILHDLMDKGLIERRTTTPTTVRYQFKKQAGTVGLALPGLDL